MFLDYRNYSLVQCKNGLYNFFILVVVVFMSLSMSKSPKNIIFHSDNLHQSADKMSIIAQRDFHGKYENIIKI